VYLLGYVRCGDDRRVVSNPGGQAWVVPFTIVIHRTVFESGFRNSIDAFAFNCVKSLPYRRSVD
jgi:hypothetical protein